MVSHSEGILKELCQAGVCLRDGKTFWYDEISRYLSDVDKKDHTNTLLCQSRKIDPHLKESNARLRRERQVIKALGKSVRYGKNKISQHELSLLKRALREAKARAEDTGVS